MFFNQLSQISFIINLNLIKKPTNFFSIYFILNHSKQNKHYLPINNDKIYIYVYMNSTVIQFFIITIIIIIIFKYKKIQSEGF